jgi:hypothetical protein
MKKKKKKKKKEKKEEKGRGNLKHCIFKLKLFIFDIFVFLAIFFDGPYIIKTKVVILVNHELS